MNARRPAARRPAPRQPSLWSRLKPIALPPEHGGWGFILESILLGWLVAFTAPGVFLALAAVMAFLARHPLRLLLKDLLRRRATSRTQTVALVALGYVGVGVLATALLVLLAPRLAFAFPLLLALPLLLIQLYYDATHRSRALVAELCGAGATGSIAAGLALLGNVPLGVALALWVALAIKSVTAVLYVRARLRMERDQLTTPAWVVVGLHGVGALMCLGLALVRLLPFTSVVGLLILTGRAGVGLSDWRTPRPAKHIGFQEIGYGVWFVVLLAVGWWLGL